MNNQVSYELNHSNYKSKIAISKSSPNPPNVNSFIHVYDQSDELVGIIEVFKKNVEIAYIRPVYIEENNNHHSMSPDSMINFLNKKSHNQLFVEWELRIPNTGIDTISTARLGQVYIDSINSGVSLDTAINYVKYNIGILSTVYLTHLYGKLYAVNRDYLNNRSRFCTVYMKSYNNITGVRGSNIPSYHITHVFNNISSQAFAHEQGHDLMLPHTFCHKISGESTDDNCVQIVGNSRGITKHKTPNNFMDYITNTKNEIRNMFYKYQMLSRVIDYTN